MKHSAFGIVGASVFGGALLSGAMVFHTPKPTLPASIPPLVQEAAHIETSTSTRQDLAKAERLVREPVPKPGEFSLRVPVLMYHYIRPQKPTYSRDGAAMTVSPEHFAAQMQEIVDLGYHTITPHELYLAITKNTTLPEKSVLITFDDGYRDQYSEAWPILKKLNLNATFFVITSYMQYPAYLNAQMLHEMDASGLATIAAHTRHHVNVPAMPPAKQIDEVQGSKKDLEKLLNHPVIDFAFPYGGLNGPTERLVSDSGYEMAFSTYFGSLHTSSSMMELRRMRVLDDEKLGPLLEKFSTK